MFGGLLADRVLGQRRTVIIGALLMAIGHFMMAFEPLFLFALLRSSSATAPSSPISRPRSASSTRRATRGATAPIRSSMSASMSGRSWRRSSAARWARCRLALGLRRRGRRHADRAYDLSGGIAACRPTRFVAQGGTRRAQAADRDEWRAIVALLILFVPTAVLGHLRAAG